MNIHTTPPPPLLIVIGLGFLAGAAVLAWFSAVATLHITRTDPNPVRAEIDARIFGVVRVPIDLTTGIRSVSMVSARAPGSTSSSNNPNRLVFNTAAGPVDNGYRQQLFARNHGTINDFFNDKSQNDLVMSNTAVFSELVRFIAAQIGVLFLTGIGALLLLLGKRGLFPDPNAGIGPV